MVVEVIEVIKVLDHEFDDLRIVAGVVSLTCILSGLLRRLELDGTSFALLLGVSTPDCTQSGNRLSHLESALLECGFEVVGLASQDDLMHVEVVRPTDDLAIREFFGVMESEKRLCKITVSVFGSTSETHLARPASKMFLGAAILVAGLESGLCLVLIVVVPRIGSWRDDCVVALNNTGA